MGAATIGSASPSDAEAAFRACHSLATMASHNPRGHILGLIGLGNIGHNIAWKMGHPAFGMRIHYHDVERKPKDVEESVNVEKFHPVLDDLLSSADCVVLCTPASPDGQPLLTTERFARFRKGARFVNVARGSLVDEEALADALERGHISAAALDVHADEPRVNPRLLRLATKGLTGQGSIDPKADQHPGRVMLTCHNAGGTVETHRGFEELSMRNILAVLGGKEPITPVNLQYLKRDDLKVGK
jgi:lactate dehydrogenase-like 2-hydroxyacid dehydrogenase